MVISSLYEQLDHIANRVMGGINDDFIADTISKGDPNCSEEAEYFGDNVGSLKIPAGFTFDGVRKIMWLEKPKRDIIVSTLKGWLCSSI